MDGLPDWIDRGFTSVAIPIGISLVALGHTIWERLDRKDGERNATRPELEAELIDDDRPDSDFRMTHLVVVENIGRGPARNVEVDWSRNPDVEPSYFRVTPRPSPKTLKINGTLEVETAYDTFAPEMLEMRPTDGSMGRLDLGTLTVTYEDTHGRRGVLAGSIQLTADKQGTELVFVRSQFSPPGSSGARRIWVL